MDSPAVRAKDKKTCYLHWVTLKSTGAKAEKTGGRKPKGQNPGKAKNT
jgi:hypothetical protein